MDRSLFSTCFHPGFSGRLAEGFREWGMEKHWPLDELKPEVLIRRAEEDRESWFIRGSLVLRRKQDTVQTVGHQSRV